MGGVGGGRRGLDAAGKPAGGGAGRREARAGGSWRGAVVVWLRGPHRLLLERFDELLAALQVGVEALHRPDNLLPDTEQGEGVT